MRWYIRFCQPYVALDSSNNTDPNSVYHDFRAFTNDSRPDWYFESTVVMRYTARVGFLGYTPKVIRGMASAGRSAAIDNGLVYDVTNYLPHESPCCSITNWYTGSFHGHQFHVWRCFESFPGSRWHGYHEEAEFADHRQRRPCEAEGLLTRSVHYRESGQSPIRHHGVNHWLQIPRLNQLWFCTRSGRP